MEVGRGLLCCESVLFLLILEEGWGAESLPIGPVISPLGWGLLLLCGRILSTFSAKGCTLSPQTAVRWSDPGCQRS